VTTPTSSTRLLAVAFLAGLAATALWTAMLGVAPGDVTLLPCPVRAASGLACPGCGMTRACLALVRGEVAGAWGLHPFAFLLVPLAVVCAAAPNAAPRAWRRMRPGLRSAGVGLALGFALVSWVARLG